MFDTLNIVYKKTQSGDDVLVNYVQVEREKMVLPVNWIPNLLLKSTQKGIKLKRGGRICTFGMMDF